MTDCLMTAATLAGMRNFATAAAGDNTFCMGDMVLCGTAWQATCMHGCRDPLETHRIALRRCLHRPTYPPYGSFEHKTLPLHSSSSSTVFDREKEWMYRHHRLTGSRDRSATVQGGFELSSVVPGCIGRPALSSSLLFLLIPLFPAEHDG